MLASLLRHRGQAEGLQIGADGFTRLSRVLALPSFVAGGFSVAEVQELVAEKDDKNRFSLCTCEGELWIRANQGHTIRTVQDSKLLRPITDPKEVSCCVHGTYLFAWPEIVACGGLSRMTRNHIHFAPRPPGADCVISGVRADAEVAIYISVTSAMAAGIEFLRSANDVLLTRGDERGMVPLKHFERAVRLVDDAPLWPPPAEPQPAPSSAHGGAAAGLAGALGGDDFEASLPCGITGAPLATIPCAAGVGLAPGCTGTSSDSEEEILCLGQAVLREA